MAREAFKYYNSLVVAGIYHFPDQDHFGHAQEPAFYFPALRKCVETHPLLTAVVKNAMTADEQYTQVPVVDLRQHVHLLSATSQDAHTDVEDPQILHAIRRLHNDPDLAFFNKAGDIPSWRIDILPLNSPKQRVFISFTYSHCVGDGMSGPYFHRTFLEALNSEPIINAAADPLVKTQAKALPVLPHLPVSLSFLLAPALGHYLPAFLSRLLGVKASASGADDETWTGPVMFDDRLSPNQPVRTALEIFDLDRETLEAVIGACRRHQTKLTSLLNEFIALCLSRRLPGYHSRFSQKKNLISCIPTNLRKAAGIPQGVLGNQSSAAYSRHPITRAKELTIENDVWERASRQSTLLATSVTGLRDQPIGLLGWISNIKAWTEEKMGQQRDSSWQLSNLMAFDGGSEGIFVEKMFFDQPADAVGLSMNFNTISVKGGELVICVAWQVGALGLDKIEGIDIEDNERRVVSEILEDLRSYIKLVAQG